LKLCANFKFPTTCCSPRQQTKENYQLPEIKRKPGKPPTYSDLSFLLVSVAAVVLRTFDSIELHRLLSHDKTVRTACLLPQVPHRKTIARRLSQLIPAAEEQIRLCGRGIVAEVAPPAAPLISAIDGRMYEAVGAKWHAKDRRQDVIPAGVRNVDTESYWSRVGLSRVGARLPADCPNARVSCSRSALGAVDGQRGGRINNFQTNDCSRRVVDNRHFISR